MGLTGPARGANFLPFWASVWRAAFVRVWLSALLFAGVGSGREYSQEM
jgi:hypothetical protein